MEANTIEEEFEGFPKEVDKFILSWLSVADLQAFSWVCNSARSRALEVYEERYLTFYQAAFVDSPLWQYLPQLEENGSLEPYFESILPPNYSFKKLLDYYSRDYDYSINAANVESFIKGCLTILGTREAQKLHPNIDATIVLENISFVNERLNGQSILDFLKSPHFTRLERKTIAKKYRYIETCLTVLVLFAFMQQGYSECKKKPATWLLTHKPLTRWLTGTNLMRLELFRALSMDILECFIDWVLYPSDITDLSHIEDLLSRLTDDHLSEYCPTFLVYRRNVLLKVIEADYHLLMDKIGVKTTKNMIEKEANQELLSFLLHHLNAERVSLALSQLRKERFEEIVGGDAYQKFMAELFSSLTCEQFCNMAKPLISDTFCCLLNSKPFLAFLKQLDVLFPKETFSTVMSKELQITQSFIYSNSFKIKMTCGSSELLVSLSKLECYFPDDILASQATQYLTKKHRKLLSGKKPKKKYINYNSALRRSIYFSERTKEIPIAPVNPQVWGKKNDTNNIENSLIFSTEKIPTTPVAKSDESLPKPIENQKTSVVTQTPSVSSEFQTEDVSFDSPDELTPLLPERRPSFRKSMFSRFCESVASSWLINGFFVVAAFGALMGVLGILGVSFAVTVCKTLAHIFTDCTIEQATWGMFIASISLGFMTFMSALISECFCSERTTDRVLTENMENDNFGGEWGAPYQNQFNQQMPANEQVVEAASYIKPLPSVAPIDQVYIHSNGIPTIQNTNNFYK
jgi:hypothetical protein